MPFLKPKTVLTLQQAASMAENQSLTESVDSGELGSALAVCPVCGSVTCEKKVVKANGVYVHPEDVANADVIERPSVND